MSNYLTNTNELTDVADAIREKGGTSASLTYPDGFVSAIGAIESGGAGNTEYVMTATDVGGFNGYYGYDYVSAGLDTSDFILDGQTIVWLELIEDSYFIVYQDPNDDDDFTILLHAGLNIIASNYTTTNYGVQLYFGFYDHESNVYGCLTLITSEYSNYKEASIGSIYAVQTRGYMQNNGEIPFDNNSMLKFKLHVLKLAS